MYSKVIQIFFFRFFSIIDYYKMFPVLYTVNLCFLSISYIVVCIPYFSFIPPPFLSPFLTMFVFYVCECFHFVNKFLYPFLDSTYKWYHMIFVFLCMVISRSMHVLQMAIFHSVLWLSNILIYICTTPLSILVLWTFVLFLRLGYYKQCWTLDYMCLFKLEFLSFLIYAQ